MSIKFNDTTKANVSYEAMTVTPAGSNIGISLNTEAFFEEYDKGMDFSEVLSRVTEVATAALDQMPEVNVSELTDYDQMKSKLSVEVISQEYACTCALGHERLEVTVTHYLKQ